MCVFVVWAEAQEQNVSLTWSVPQLASKGQSVVNYSGPPGGIVLCWAWPQEITVPLIVLNLKWSQLFVGRGFGCCYSRVCVRCILWHPLAGRLPIQTCNRMDEYNPKFLMITFRAHLLTQPVTLSWSWLGADQSRFFIRTAREGEHRGGKVNCDMPCGLSGFSVQTRAVWSGWVEGQNCMCMLGVWVSFELEPPRNLTHMLFRNTNPKGELESNVHFFDNCGFVSIPDV